MNKKLENQMVRQLSKNITMRKILRAQLAADCYACFTYNLKHDVKTALKAADEILKQVKL